MTYDTQGRRVLPSADMDDLVLMGLARDSAYAEVAQLKAALAAIVETTEGQPGALVQECRQIARAALQKQEGE